MPEKKTKVTVSLEESLADKLAQRAEREGLSRSAYAKKIVTNALTEAIPGPQSDRTGQDMTAALDRWDARLQEQAALLQQLVAAKSAKFLPREELAPVSEFDSEPIKELAENLPRVHHEIVSLHTQHEHQLQRLRADLAKAVAALLVNCGDIDPKVARDWVNKNLAQKVAAPRSDVRKEHECPHVDST